jgi:ribokinase
VVIKLGARGAFIYDGKHFDVISSYKAPRVVDTTAAGDTFTAALTLDYLANGGNIKNAARYGAAAAAIAVSRPGASSSVPSAEEVVEFMRTQPMH